MVLAEINKIEDQCDVFVLAQAGMTVLLPILSDFKKPVMGKPALWYFKGQRGLGSQITSVLIKARERHMINMKIGCCTAIDNYFLLSELGYDFIEMSGTMICAATDAEFEQIRRRISVGPLPCKGFNAFLPPGLKMAGAGYDHAAAKNYLEKALYRGSLLGISAVGIGGPQSRILSGDFDRKKTRGQIGDFLKTELLYLQEFSSMAQFKQELIES